MTTVNLSFNRINHNGTQYLSNALQENKVISLNSNSIIHFSFHQILTTLDLSFNRITHQGAQYLAKVLDKNQVVSLSCLLTVYRLRSTETNDTETARKWNR